jgi:two-component system chemotaxis response regulator CheY
MAKRVLSVGQCLADHGSIARTLHQHFQAEVVPADDVEDALALVAAEPFDLVLVNRILDADGSSGLEVIRRLKGAAMAQQVPVMLVSNYDDAQVEAVHLGALPGFGKAALGQPHTLSRFKDVLG